MTGMSFAAFVTLLTLGFVAAIVMHSIVHYRMLEGPDGFVAKWIAGWIGAWLGSPVLGHWSSQIQKIYIVPALLGAFVGAFSYVAIMKANAPSRANVMASKITPGVVVPEILKKAG